MRKLVTILALAAAALAVAAVATAGSGDTNKLAYEFDNGSTWTLQKNTAALNTTFSFAGYADVGIVVDLGPLSSLSGVDVTGTGVVDNIWISPGTTEANTPGTHSLSSAVDFAYGFDNGSGSTFWMMADPVGTYLYQNATLAQLQVEYPDAEAYAWVGVVYSGTSVSGSVSAVNGKSVGNRTFSITDNGDGTATAVVH